MANPPIPDALPDPAEQPTVSVWPTAARALGIGRNSAYEAAKRGEIPTIKIGGRILVPTAALRRMLGLDDAELTGEVTAAKTLASTMDTAKIRRLLPPKGPQDV